MTREEFTGPLLGYIIKKIPVWLPEEATAEHHLDIFQQRMTEHILEINNVVKRFEGKSDGTR